jgi:tetratricopeptide (TPR) repeat protein
MRRTTFILVAILLLVLGIGLIYRTLNNQEIEEESITVSKENPDEIQNPGSEIPSEQEIKGLGILPESTTIQTIQPEISDEQDSREKRSLASIHLQNGYSKLKKREYQRAIPDFEEAIKLDGNEPNSYIGLGLAYYKINDVDKAIEAIDQALNFFQGRHSSKYVTAYKLLGEIYYYKDDLDKALGFWEKALILDPEDQNLRKIYLKASREYEIHKGFNSETTRHFIIQYEGGERNETGRKVIDILEDAYSQIGRELSYYPSKELTVILYSNQQFHYITDGPAWSSGIYDGKIRVPIGGVHGDELQLRQVLFHEYTHSLIHSITDRCPTWLNEGLAQYFEGRNKDIAMRVMRELHRKKAVIPLELLEGSFLRLNKYQADIAYSESLSAVSYMVERYGLYRVKDLLIELSKGSSIDDSFRSSLYIPYKEFEKDWMKTLLEG